MTAMCANSAPQAIVTAIPVRLFSSAEPLRRPLPGLPACRALPLLCFLGRCPRDAPSCDTPLLLLLLRFVSPGHDARERVAQRPKQLIEEELDVMLRQWPVFVYHTQ